MFDMLHNGLSKSLTNITVVSLSLFDVSLNVLLYFKVQKFSLYYILCIYNSKT